MRVTNLSLKYQIGSQIQASQKRLIDAQQTVSDGRRIRRLSDDPIALSRAFDFGARLSAVDQYRENAQYGTALLSLGTSTLAEVESLILSARDVAINAADAQTFGDESIALADQIESITGQVMNLMNSRYNDRYIFGGHDLDTPPFAVGHDGLVVWQGDNNPIYLATGPEGMRTQVNIDGRRATAGRPAMISRGDVDLDPDISLKTNLADLRGGEGVAMGSFEIHDREGRIGLVDLGVEQINDISDLIETINTMDEIEVVASINAEGNGITLTDVSVNPDPLLGLKVLEVDEGTTAADLGIWEFAGTLDGVVEGTDVNPRLTEETAVDLLNGGSGYDRGEIYIVNGDRSDYIDMSGLSTVGEMLERINASEVGVRAEINDEATGIEVHSLSFGTTLHIGDLGNGHTAADLGLVGTAEEQSLFELLDDLENAARSEDRDTARELIDSLSQAVDALINSRAGAGTQLQELQLADNRLLGISLDLEMAKADIEEADLSEAVLNLTASQIVYEAALATTTSVLRLNLASYL